MNEKLKYIDTIKKLDNKETEFIISYLKSNNCTQAQSIYILVKALDISFTDATNMVVNCKVWESEKDLTNEFNKIFFS